MQNNNKTVCWIFLYGHHSPNLFWLFNLIFNFCNVAVIQISHGKPKNVSFTSASPWGMCVVWKHGLGEWKSTVAVGFEVLMMIAED